SNSFSLDSSDERRRSFSSTRAGRRPTRYWPSSIHFCTLVRVSVHAAPSMLGITHVSFPVVLRSLHSSLANQAFATALTCFTSVTPARALLMPSWGGALL